MESDEKVECPSCEDVHSWSERVVNSEECLDGYAWNTYRCPVCGHEFFYPNGTRDLTISRTCY
jgi:rubredoxin